MFKQPTLTDRRGAVVFHDPPIARFLFGNSRMAVLWLVVRVYLGWQWLEAGLHKLYAAGPNGEVVWGQINEGWMVTGASILGYWQRAVAVPAPPARAPITYDWFRAFLQFLIDTGSHPWMAKLIVLGEIAVGVGLILGAFVGVAAFFGAFMNMNFLLAGTTSSNPVLFLLAVLLMLGWKVAGYYGLDRYLLPIVGTPWERLSPVSESAPTTPPARPTSVRA